MRVVIVGSKGYPSTPGAGGVEQGVRHVAEELSALGHDVIVYERGQRATRTEGRVTIRCVPFVNRRTLAGWSHLILSLIDALISIRGVDVYHVHCAQNGFACLPLRLTGARVLFHIHGCEWRAGKWGVLMSLAIRATCIAGAIGAHTVVVVCDRSQRFLGNVLRPTRKVRLIPNGVSSTLLAAEVAPVRRREFLFVGRIVPQKRLDLLLDAFRSLPNSDVTLTIVGPTSYSETHVRQLIERTRDDTRISWLGQRSSRTVRELYRRCFAVVLPSDHEGCSNVLLEALAAGCCIVASDIPENRAVTSNAAALVQRGDATALADTLSRLLWDPTEVERLRCAARARAAQLPTWEAVTREILTQYEARDASLNAVPTPSRAVSLDRITRHVTRRAQGRIT
jgi:glycosyltransferase involved in cell wall biosynthesis